jgi:hypothetical protein
MESPRVLEVELVGEGSSGGVIWPNRSMEACDKTEGGTEKEACEPLTKAGHFWSLELGLLRAT